MTAPTDREVIESMLEAAKTADPKYLRSHDCHQYFKQTIKALPALTRLLEREKARQWQPIETAPKDGTRIIVCAMKDVSAYLERENSKLGYWGRKVIGPFVFQVYWSGNYWQADGFAIALDPQHWMPLPEPPEQVVGERG